MIDARLDAEFRMKLMTAILRPLWWTKYMSPTVETMRDSKADVEKPWMIRAARR
jgi:hypothetical protein